VPSALAQELGPGPAQQLPERNRQELRTGLAVRRSGRLGGLPLLAALLHDLSAFAALDPMSALCAAILSSLK
jgi:hypothetical protein